jgi:beta-glucanase (GH16 family)
VTRLLIRALVLAGCCGGLAACGGGGSSATTETSTFRRPDPAAWRVSVHPLGRGAFQAANVRFGPGGLSLLLPPGTFDGGEVQATELRGDGRYTTRMRASAAPGSLSAFFLYLHDDATDSSDELDFEIPAGQPHRAILTVWRAGTKTPIEQRTVALDFDPSAALHDYAFVRDGGEVRFEIDGREVFRSSKAPTAALRPIFNAWYPTWLEPSVPTAAGEMVVDRYAFTG